MKLVRSKRVKDRNTAAKLEYATKRIGKVKKEELIKNLEFRKKKQKRI